MNPFIFNELRMEKCKIDSIFISINDIIFYSPTESNGTKRKEL